MILDGWGLGQKSSSDAILAAKTPFFDGLLKLYPNSTLLTHSMHVGLPDGQMGNSEVGHLNLGAGRVVYQDLALINKTIQEDQLKNKPALKKIKDYCEANHKALHLVGLVSDGGVHSHIDHLKALISIFENSTIENIYIHAITDGRDTDPKSGIHFITELNQFLEHKRTKLSSIIGRYFAMDRDKRWERIKKAYDLKCFGKGIINADPVHAIKTQYENNITDEFLEGIKCVEQNIGNIQAGDAVLCFNFRTDRLRELTEVLTREKIDEYNMAPIPLMYTTMTNYDDSYKNVNIVFDKEDISKTLGEIISIYGLSQLRIAETEKYPHVSFFFSGGREKLFSGERRLLIPSPKVATYDLKPQMSAVEVTDALIDDIENNGPDFVVINYANADMVGHTGVFSAVVKAVETVDKCIAKLIPILLTKEYDIILLADHGNADYMINEDGTPNTAHTKNLVPCILISNQNTYKLKSGKLADIAPTLLQLLELPIPIEMSGESLLIQSK